MDTDQVRRLLKNSAGCIKVAEVTMFECHRKTWNGVDQMVRVEIRDYGDGESERFHIVAKSGAKQASGNPADTIDEAVAKVRWTDLD